MQNVPTSVEEAIAVANGEDLQQYRVNRKFLEELYQNVEQLEDLSPSEWPTLVFSWDLTLEGQRFSLDGMKPEDFHKFYPEGFRCGRVLLNDLDAKLCHFSRRDTLEELWGTGCKRKLARVIRYLSRGLPISPPLVKPLANQEVILQGGHHRYAAAKFYGVTELPIHVELQCAAEVEILVPVRWTEARPLAQAGRLRQLS